eukprot:365612-Chlamydomonas_euryale.AAC.3
MRLSACGHGVGCTLLHKHTTLALFPKLCVVGGGGERPPGLPHGCKAAAWLHHGRTATAWHAWPPHGTHGRRIVRMADASCACPTHGTHARRMACTPPCRGARSTTCPWTTAAARARPVCA